MTHTDGASPEEDQTTTQIDNLRLDDRHELGVKADEPGTGDEEGAIKES
jgi:hypothetical protein